MLPVTCIETFAIWRQQPLLWVKVWQTGTYTDVRRPFVSAIFVTNRNLSAADRFCAYQDIQQRIITYLYGFFTRA